MRFSLYFFFLVFLLYSFSSFFSFTMLPLCVLFKCLSFDLLAYQHCVNCELLVYVISFIFGTTSQHVLHSEKSLLPFRVRISIRDNWIFVHYLRCVTFLPSIFLVMVNQMWHNCLRYSTLSVDEKISLRLACPRMTTELISTDDDDALIKRDSDSHFNHTSQNCKSKMKWFFSLRQHEKAKNTHRNQIM